MKKNYFSVLSRLSLAMFFATGYALAEDSTLVEKQQNMIETLDSLNSSVMGLRIGGSAKAGAFVSTAKSDQLVNKADNRETQAFTDVNLNVNARPSAETEARVELRLHKDWQSAYDESWNPVLGHWFSYDGKILNKHVDFNLGYMRVGYTPLTLYVPQAEILQEADIFASKRVEALALRNLDTTSNRLLQGLNAEYNSFELGPISNIHAQVTGARLRAIAKKYDQVFFDFDWSDRYLAGANAGVEAFGFSLGGNFVTSFDREKSSRAVHFDENLFYEENKVYSGVVGFDSKDLVGGAIHFGVNAEIGRSHWNYESDTRVADTSHVYSINPFYAPQYGEDGIIYETVMGSSGEIALPVSDTSFYITDSISIGKTWKHSFIDKKRGMALSVSPYVDGSVANVDFSVRGTFTKNDKDFWSEQASSGYYAGNTSILNADASFSGSNESILENFRAGSLESMYFSIYNTNVLSQPNIMNKSDAPSQLNPAGESKYTFGRLSNNYKMAHYYKNAYQSYANKYMEYAEAAAFLDPSVNMAMPMGLATPDRMGFAVSGDFSWNDAVAMNLRFSKYNEDEIDNEYTTWGAGLMVDVAPFLGLDRRIKLQGSMEKGEESDYYKREVTRVNGGVTIDVWGPVALLGGVQLLNKKYGKGFDMISVVENDGRVVLENDLGEQVVRPTTEVLSNEVRVNEIEEMLAMGGLQIRLGAGAFLDLQGGLMTNTVKYTQQITSVSSYEGLDGNQVQTVESGEKKSFELGIDKLLMLANVTVLF